ncbi:MAG: DUF721 domain-containing protein [Azoarcus sp.]|jgi:hypothetical protein|nr:DUF721 domain-containing protein [Azoarcus sp.]
MSTLLYRYLGRDTPLARLQDHAARLERLQAVFTTALPAQFVHACHVANLKDNGELVVNARGSAIAVRLMQMVPSLLEHFARAGYPLERIKIKVALPEAQPAPAPTARALSVAARAQIETFAATLPTDAPLRKSLETLARRARVE